MRRFIVLSAVAALANGMAATAVSGQQRSTAQPVVANGEPGSIQVVRVPVPPSFVGANKLGVSFASARGFHVLGDTSRTVAASSTEVLVSLMISSTARAGRNHAVTARFDAGIGSPVEVAIDVDIPRHRGVTLTAAGRELGVLRGDRFVFEYRVANVGNATDTVQLQIALPNGWRGREGQGTIALDPGASAPQTTRITVSPGSATGASVVRLFALAGHDTVGRGDATIEVGDPGARGRAAGPMMKLTSAAAGTTTGAAVGHSLLIEGPIDDQLQVSASAALMPEPSAQPFSLSRLIYGQRIPRLSLTSPMWRLQLGTASLTVSELAGNLIGGTGASFEKTIGRWHAASMAGRPGIGATQGELLAGSLGRTLASGQSFTVTASHLVDPNFGANELDALAGDLRAPLGVGTALSAGVAERRYHGASGLGWQTEVRREAGNGTLELRAANTPGGTAAFARANQELSAQVSQYFGIVGFAGAAWRTRDSSASWRSLAVNGWSLRPAVRLGQSANWSFEARQSTFAAEGQAGRMGNGEFALSTMADARAGMFYVNGSVTSASLSRTTAVNSVRFETQTKHDAAHGAVGISSLFGRAELTVTGDRSGPESGLPARQVVYSANLVDVRLVPWSRVLSGRVNARRIDWLGDRPAAYAMESAVDVMLPRSTRLTLEADRDPFLASMTSPNHWVFGVRFETGLSLPRRRIPVDEGVVFRDLNANGMQDRNEPGVGGVVVRRGFETAITRADGRFEFANANAAPAEVDSRSLPAGLVSPPTGAARRGRVIGLITVATAQVHLALAGADADRVSGSDLMKVALVAKDANGKAWIARAATLELRVFDALPPGRYTLDIDASSAAEPLRTEATTTLDVMDGKTPAPATITLHGRTLKIRQMSKETP